MLSLEKPVEASPQRLTSSSREPILDYITHLDVDSDIFSRIRALRLSAKLRSSPRTPFPSEDDDVKTQASIGVTKMKTMSLGTSVIRNSPDIVSTYAPPLTSPCFVDGQGKDLSRDTLQRSSSFHGFKDDSRSQIPSLVNHNETVRRATVDITGEATNDASLAQASSLGARLKEIRAKIPVIITGAIGNTEERPQEPVEDQFQKASVVVDRLNAPVETSAWPPWLDIFPSPSPFHLPGGYKSEVSSMKSGRSKCAQRHGLLRTSSHQDESVDLGLPVQPILVTSEPTLLEPELVNKEVPRVQTVTLHHQRTEKAAQALGTVLSGQEIIDPTAEAEHSTPTDAPEPHFSSQPVTTNMVQQDEGNFETMVGHATKYQSGAGCSSLAEIASRIELPSSISNQTESIKSEWGLSNQFPSREKSKSLSISRKAQSSQGPSAPGTLVTDSSFRRFYESATNGSNHHLQPMISERSSSLHSQMGAVKRITEETDENDRRHSSLSYINETDLDARKRAGSEPGRLTRYSVTNIPLTDKVQIRTRWLQDLLTGNNERAYSPQLTALPAKVSRNVALSQPLKSASSLADESNRMDRQSISATIAKTINDLERLLEEALLVARRAAEREEWENVPNLLASAAAVLHGGRAKPTMDSLSYRGQSGTSSPFIPDFSLVASHPNSLNSIHESLVGLVRSLSSQSSCHDSGFGYINSPSDPMNGLQHDRKLESSWSSVKDQPAAVSSGLSLLQDQNTEQKSRSRQISVDLGVKIISRPSDDVGKATDTCGPIDEHRTASAANDVKTPVMSELGISKRKISRKLSRNAAALTYPSTVEILQHIQKFRSPPIQPRNSSRILRNSVQITSATSGHDTKKDSPTTKCSSQVSTASVDGPAETEVVFSTTSPPLGQPEDIEMNTLGQTDTSQALHRRRHVHRHQRPVFDVSLKGRSHISLREAHNGFSLSRSHRRQPIARDWTTMRKRVVAAIACISTTLIGILIGIYAGEVPSIQYYIADMHHYAILGNVFLFIGLSIPTFFCWPLPLLHGRKPYILGALAAALPLLFPPAIVCATPRSPMDPKYRIGILLPRAVMGLCLGFANMNFQSILLDLFGASLQSGNPHQEVVDPYDVRRHGGGMGLWLGIWTWAFIGSIGIGFLIGAVTINYLPPSWGFYVSIIITAVILLLNIIAPEVRRSPYRRSIAEVRLDAKDVSRRLARGEVMMHRVQTGPKWWGEEMYHGLLLNLDMLRQPGFLVVALYMGWIYGQIVLIVVLLGSLTSKYYMFKSPDVGACVASIPIGVLLAVPFQKASIFSRARHHNVQRTNSMTFDKKVTWSSHLVRRAVFTLTLPFAGLAYTLSSGGPPTPWILPVVFAGLFGFLSGLAIAECNGFLMETFDTSDLQAGMTGRPRGSRGENGSFKRTNYSSFPRVASAFAVAQSWGFLVAAAATGTGGVAQRHLGQQAATGVMAGILLVLTVLLLCALIRWKEVQVIPNSKGPEMEVWKQKRRESIQRQREHPSGDIEADAEEVELWRPIVIGNPSGRTRNMSVLELGHLTRWSEIRKKNKLIDEMGYEGKHPHLATLDSVRAKFREKRGNAVDDMRGRLGSRKGRPKTPLDKVKEREMGFEFESTSDEIEGLEREFSWDAKGKGIETKKEDEE